MTNRIRPLVVGVLLALLTWLAQAPAGAGAAFDLASNVSTYNYDAPVGGVVPTYAHSERGPPTYPDTEPFDSAVDRGSSESLARPGTTSYTYDADATPAKRHEMGISGASRATATATGSVEVTDRTLSSLPASQVAENAGTRSGPPRDALGRFTTGAGGESTAAAVGRTAHANYSNTLGGGDYVFNRALPGSRLRPDAASYSQNIVRELKPDTPRAISRGWWQVNEYKAYLEEVTEQPWTAYVDVYTP